MEAEINQGLSIVRVWEPEGQLSRNRSQAVRQWVEIPNIRVPGMRPEKTELYKEE